MGAREPRVLKALGQRPSSSACLLLSMELPFLVSGETVEVSNMELSEAVIP